MSDNNTQLLSPSASGERAMLDTQISRQAQEVQAAMIIAKRFPRDETAARQRILNACKRKGLAEEASYVFPRGGKQVTGPSIRLAEALAQAWGNVDFGIIELDQRLGESTVMSYAWDLETNTRATKVFTVKHQRSARGSINALEDPRDIYEMTANQGARRLRACILAVIPGDVVEEAERECDKTMAGKNPEPLIDRARKMVTAFADHGVTQEMIETRLGHKLEATIEQELVVLRKIFAAIRDGMGKREDYFNLQATASTRPKFAGPPETQAAADPDDDQIPGAEATTAERTEPVQPSAETTLPAKEPEPPLPTEPYPALLVLGKRDGVTEQEILEHARALKMAKDNQKLSDLSESKLKGLVQGWTVNLAVIRGRRAQK